MACPIVTRDLFRLDRPARGRFRRMDRGSLAATLKVSQHYRFFRAKQFCDCLFWSFVDGDFAACFRDVDEVPARLPFLCGAAAVYYNGKLAGAQVGDDMAVGVAVKIELDFGKA